MNDLSVIVKACGDVTPWTRCPPFWVSKPDMGMPFIASLKQATTRVIGKSAGGREIIAIEYGVKESLEFTSDCLHSSLAAKMAPSDPTDIFPDSFYGSKRRRRPVLAIQGGIHGGELSGTVASLNLCQVIETGKDLRGKEWPRLAHLARETRIVIVPWLNMDGVERCPIPNTSGAPEELSMRCEHGVAADGTPYIYPHHKNVFPIPPEKTAFMGTYFNDNGVNLQYDFCMPRRQPETVAWMEYYLAERPDGVLIWHCNAGSMMGPPEYYLPEGHKLEFSRLAGALRSRLLREGLEIGRMSWAGLSGLGKPFMEQSTATYHVCGGMPIMCEMPAGTASCPFSCEEMLDIGLLTIEEVLFYAHRDGLRPYELWDKVKKKLAG